MRYFALIEEGTNTTAFGVIVPDLPGCFSAGDTLPEAMAAAQEAVAVWIDAALGNGQAIPSPTFTAEHCLRSYEGWIAGNVDV